MASGRTLALVLSIALTILPAETRAAPTDGSTLPVSRGSTGLAEPASGAAEPASSSLFTGAATARIPIEVARGIQGMQPRLALSYSSHAAQSSSWVGAGWSLGPSRIERSLEEGVPAYDATDTFTLDGEELVKKGSEGEEVWDTRRSSFRRIERVGRYGWDVREKDGTVSRYGYTEAGGAQDECAIRAPSGEPFAFLLCEREDLHGNGLRVRYDRSDPGIAYPERITYSGRSVEFVLEPDPRPDPSLGYRAGFRRERTRRLHAIDVLAGGERIRRYELDYGSGLGDGGRSLLRAVRLHGTDYGSAHATPPREWRLRYRDGGPEGWARADDWAIPEECRFVTDEYTDGGTRLADINGDALPDLLRQEKIDQRVENTEASGIWLNTGSGFERTESWTFPMSPPYELPSLAAIDRPEAWRNAFVAKEADERHSMGTVLTDMDADGRADLLVMKTTLAEYNALSSFVTINARQEYLHNTGSGWESRLLRSLDDGSGYSLLTPNAAGSGWWTWAEGLYDENVASGPGWPTGAPVPGDALPAYGLASSTYYSDDIVVPEPVAEWSFTVDGTTTLAELNGDGRPELLTRTNIVGAAPGSPEALIGFEHSFTRIREDGAGFEPLVSDRFNVCTGTSQECNERRVNTFYKIGVQLERPALEWVADGSQRFGKRYVDLNGDGLDDQATAVDVSPQVAKETLLNGGSDFLGAEPGAAWTLPGDLYFDSIDANGVSRDQGLRFLDLNGDGRVDLFQSRNEEASAGEATSRAWLNTGDPARGWSEESTVSLPEGMALTDEEGRDRGVRIVDLDGDGRQDILRCAGREEGGPAREAYLHEGRVPDLLKRFETPLGGITRFHYVPSPSSGQYLPRAFSLVDRIETKVRTGDGGSPRIVAEKRIGYEQGAFDAEAREFRGFGRVEVTEIDPDAPEPGVFRRTEVAFHQDDARAGLVESREVRDAEGALWLRTEKAYTEDDDGPPYVSLVRRVLREEHDAAAGPPRRSLREFEYDAFGNRIETTEWGEVSAELEDLVPRDTRVQVVEYATNPAIHLVGLPARKALRSGADPNDPESEKVRETKLFYDGDEAADPGVATPTEGLLTRKVEVKDFAAGTGPTTRYGYDAYGNRTEIRSPRAVAGEIEGAAEIEYDETFHTFPVRRWNEKGHRTDFSYTTPAACGLQQPKGAGLVHEAEGPNDLANGTRTLRCYDAFGRQVLEQGPGGLSRTRWSYVDVPGAARIYRSERTTEAPSTRTTVTHKDGLGRTWRVERQGPQGRDVVARTEYDAAGRVVREEAPHFAGESAQAKRYTYDVLDRRRSVDRPGPGRVTTTRYERGLVTVTEPVGEEDPRPRVTERERDAFGRVVRIVEDAAGARHETLYRYDVAGKLERVEDSEGNITRIRYDELGRKRRLRDPDAGLAQFRYDANGNLRLRVDPQGFHVWRYDALDRPLRRLHNEAGTVARWRYDTAPGGVGRLAWREDEAGRYAVAAYDALGRPTTERYERGGETLEIGTRYDPLGQRSERSYPSGRTIEWVRDARGYLEAIRGADGTSYASGIRWDARERLVAWEAGNGVPTSRRFDAATGRLEEVAIGAGSELLDLAYRYDPGDRIRAIEDGNDASRRRSFRYDALDRLARATGPFASDGGRRSLYYDYDPLGNLTCRASTSPEECTGGTDLAYPAPGEPRPHAARSVDGEPAHYDAGGNLERLGARRYRYDALGRLEEAREGGETLARFAYTEPGRRARVVDQSGRRTLTRHLVTEDFEWDVTRGLARIHVSLGGRSVATQVEPFDPAGASEDGDPAWGLPGLVPGGGALGPLALGLLPAGAGAALLLLQLARLHRRGVPLRRPALAGSAAVVLYVGLLPAAGHAVRADGDLNGDGRLNAADARLALLVARGEREPTSSERLRGDVAPLDGMPDAEPELGPDDLALLYRALGGDDVDGDGLSAAEELDAGASPFRSDTDHDGLSDAEELAAGTDPADPDTDGDGVGDAAEVNGATDAMRADTDGDGREDGEDSAPLTGVRFLHADHLGSSVVTTGEGGEPLARVTYRPFGGTVSGSAPPEHGFTGQRFVRSLGLYDYGARWYDPRLGRFLQPDSMVPEPSDPQTLNRYSYVRNNPLSRIDPTGNFSWGFGSFLSSFGSFFRSTFVQPAVDYSLGFAGGLGHSLGMNSLPSSGSTAFDEGAGAGAMVGALGGTATELAGLPLQMGGSLLGAVPGGSAVASPLNQAGDRLDAIGSGMAHRADSFSEGSRRSAGGIIANDIGSTFSGGLLSNGRGIAAGLGGVIEGASTLDGGRLADGLVATASALVPRFGGTAGPGFGGRTAEHVYNNADAIASLDHDIGYGRAESNADFLASDVQLLQDLAGSVVSRNELPQPGPVGQVYRLGEMAAFGAMAGGRASIEALR